MEFGGLSFDSLVPLIFSNKGLKLNIVQNWQARGQSQSKVQASNR